MLKLRDAEDTPLRLTFSKDKIVADRSGSLYTVWGPVRQRTTEAQSVRTFLLHFNASSCEVFIDGGKMTVSGRIFCRGTEYTVAFLTADDENAEAQLIELRAAILPEEK